MNFRTKCIINHGLSLMMVDFFYRIYSLKRYYSNITLWDCSKLKFWTLVIQILEVKFVFWIV